MRVYEESILPCDADLAWAAVQTSALLREVCKPLVTFRSPPGEELPETWIAKQTVRCRSYLFGLIPLGTRTLVFDAVDQRQRTIQTRESDPLVRRWDHVIRVAPLGPGKCRYSDEIEIDAGWLTPAVWLFARGLYRHRQRRWKRVAKRLQEGSGARSA